MTTRLACLVAILAVVTPLTAQDELTKEIQNLTRRIKQLEQQQDAMSREFESFTFRDVVPDVEGSRFGFSPSASKVYGVEKGLSIGGYGEFLFAQNSGELDVFDAQRVVLYFGYKFDDNFVFNSEIEFEHGSTSSSSGSTNSSGSVSVEQAYLDWLWREPVNLRAGVLLAPMGLINERHEPNTFLPSARPVTEQRIIPTTWREPGVGLFGESGGFGYRAYAMTSLNGEGFGAGGLRGGRQRANRSAADDFGFVGRLDWTDTPGLLVGASVFHGKTGQDGIDDSGNTIPDLSTTIVDAHLSFEPGPWTFRALYAHSFLKDTAQFNANTGNNLAKELNGYYVEVGYDILTAFDSPSEASLSPFFRHERVDTQQRLEQGFTAESGRDERVLTFGVNFQPVPGVVIKADFQDFREGHDVFNVLFGYAF